MPIDAYPVLNEKRELKVMAYLRPLNEGVSDWGVLWGVWGVLCCTVELVQHQCRGSEAIRRAVLKLDADWLESLVTTNSQVHHKRPTALSVVDRATASTA